MYSCTEHKTQLYRTQNIVVQNTIYSCTEHNVQLYRTQNTFVQNIKHSCIYTILATEARLRQDSLLVHALSYGCRMTAISTSYHMWQIVFVPSVSPRKKWHLFPSIRRSVRRSLQTRRSIFRLPPKDTPHTELHNNPEFHVDRTHTTGGVCEWTKTALRKNIYRLRFAQLC